MFESAFENASCHTHAARDPLVLVCTYVASCRAAVLAAGGVSLGEPRLTASALLLLEALLLTGLSEEAVLDGR